MHECAAGARPARPAAARPAGRSPRRSRQCASGASSRAASAAASSPAGSNPRRRSRGRAGGTGTIVPLSMWAGANHSIRSAIRSATGSSRRNFKRRRPGSAPLLHRKPKTRPCPTPPARFPRTDRHQPTAAHTECRPPPPTDSSAHRTHTTPAPAPPQSSARDPRPDPAEEVRTHGAQNANSQRHLCPKTLSTLRETAKSGSSRTRFCGLAHDRSRAADSRGVSSEAIHAAEVLPGTPTGTLPNPTNEPPRWRRSGPAAPGSRRWAARLPL